MNRFETLYIHALARLTYEASARGKHPVPRDGFMGFFQKLIGDPLLQSDPALDLFNRCFSMEVEREKTRGVKQLWK